LMSAGNAVSADISRFMQAGADEVLFKPVDISKLLEKIHERVVAYNSRER
jgi:DNA-binding response OmpR family regulator